MSEIKIYDTLKEGTIGFKQMYPCSEEELKKEKEQNGDN